MSSALSSSFSRSVKALSTSTLSSTEFSSVYESYELADLVGETLTRRMCRPEVALSLSEEARGVSGVAYRIE